MDIIPVTKKIGNRSEVWNNLARQTPGGLQKKDLFISKTGKITSKKASLSSKKRIAQGKGFCKMCLEKYGKEAILTEVKTNTEVKEQVPFTKESAKKLEKEIDTLLEKIFSIIERTGKETSKEIRKLKKEKDKKQELYFDILEYLGKQKKSKNKKKSK